jgi:hypothetical protein
VLEKARCRRKGGKPFPVPPCKPIVGHYTQIFPIDGSAGHFATIQDWFTRLGAAHGGNFMLRLPLSEWSPSARFYHTTDPQNVEHMLKTNFENYPKGSAFYRAFHDLLGEGIFNVDGAGWLVQRKTASHEFSVSRFKHFMSEVLLEHSLELCGIVGEQQGAELDLQRLFAKFTLESIGKIAYGVQLGCMRRDMPFERCFDQATHCSMMRFLTPWWRLQKALGVGNEGVLAAALREINSFSADVIAQRRALPADALAQHCDLLSRFMQAHPPPPDATLPPPSCLP